MQQRGGDLGAHPLAQGQLTHRNGQEAADLELPAALHHCEEQGAWWTSALAASTESWTAKPSSHVRTWYASAKMKTSWPSPRSESARPKPGPSWDQWPSTAQASVTRDRKGG